MPSRRAWIFECVTVSALVVTGCSEPTNPPLKVPPNPQYARVDAGLSVRTATPAQAPLDTTLDVQITGSAFEPGSRAEWLRGGLPDPRVRTNSTRFVSSTSLVANITISLDAAASAYDIAVITANGKKGIGTELFTVLAVELLAGPPGGSAANAVNASGIVAGGRAGGCAAGRTPAYWSNGGLPVDLPLIAPYCNGTALYINESGMMIGRLDPSGAGFPVRWVPNGAGYDVYALNPPSDGTTAAFVLDGLNKSGVVVGNRWHGANTVPYSWSQGGGWGVMPINAETATTGCYVEALNDNGEGVGECWTAGTGKAVFWGSSTTSPVLLPQLAGYTSASSGKALNNVGTIVGYAVKQTKSGSVTAGVRWTRQPDGSWSNPGLLPDVPTPGASRGEDVNDDGVIVGVTSISNKNRAFILFPGQPIRDLGSVGGETWAFSVTPAGSFPTLVAGTTFIANYNRGTIWRP
jgi:probable HAF family extracellular repeat protein